MARVGPGLITRVTDDDPSGIATYSQAGAQFGLNMLWTMPLTFPLMAAVQSMCANLGRVTGKGLASNTLNIAADVAAMGEVAELVSGVNRHLMTSIFVFITLALQMSIPYSKVTAYFIVHATAVTLHATSVTDINTAAQAARALRPLAGNFAYLLFAMDILGVGLIGVPLLTGSGAHALAETMDGKEGLERKVGDALGFYAIVAVSVLAGLAIQYSPISPMKALFWSAVINGVVAVPLLVVIIFLVSKKSVMGEFTASKPVIVLGRITAIVMGAASVAMFSLSQTSRVRHPRRLL